MAPPRAPRPAQAPAAAPSTGRTGAVAATAAPAARPANPTSLATEALTRWAQAWASKDMKAYVNAYVPGFKGSLGSHAAWRSQREARIVPRDRIEVRVSEVKAQWEGERIEATFRQQYESGNLKVRSRRTVVLEQVEGRWLIREESGR